MTDYVTQLVRAGEGEVFLPGCFDGSLGKKVPLKVAGQQRGEAELVSYRVSETGEVVELTLAIPERIVPKPERFTGSLGFNID